MSSGRERCARPRAWAPLLGLVLLVSPSLAGAPSGSETPAVANVAPARERASIVLIAELGADRELALLLRELVGRRGVDAEITRAERFDPEALFATGDHEPLRIFVAPGASEARLYFRAPGGERYLVRKLRLPTGLDAVGRELVGQVVESSVGALLDSSQGLSREQASREIAGDAPPAPTSAPRPPPPRPAPPLAIAPERTSASLEPRLAARYALTWLGADLGVRHGPGLALGIRRVSGVLLGVEVTGERCFTQTFSASGLEGQVQASNLALVAELGLLWGRSGRLVLSAGPNLELARVRVTRVSRDVTPADEETHAGAGLRLALGQEWALGHFAFGAAAFGDIALERTHYDLLQGASGSLRLVEVPSFRPGASISVSVH